MCIWTVWKRDKVLTIPWMEPRFVKSPSSQCSH